jgi:hypothetical protein
MDLDDFIIAVFCVVDEAITRTSNGRRLRQRGPAPLLADSEVVTMEVVGEYLGLAQESALFAYFRRHYAHYFPALRSLHRTTFVRQAANLWRLKELVWQEALEQLPHDPAVAIADSFPLPVCQFARASLPTLSWRGGVWQGYAGAPDLLWPACPRPPGMARRHDARLYRACQCVRTGGAAGIGRRTGRIPGRRPQLLVAQDGR